MNKFMVGQRVTLGDEIGTVVKPERKDLPNNDKNIWVFSPTKNFASYYAIHNVKPLPNGQL
jgi:hypothetical protein